MGRDRKNVRREDSKLMRLELAVETAQSDAAFVNGSTMPVVSMMVAVIVAMAVSGAGDATANNWLSAAGLALVVVGLLAIWERKRVARKLVHARYALAKFKEGKDPAFLQDAIKSVEVDHGAEVEGSSHVSMFTAYAFPIALFLVALVAMGAQRWG